MWGVLRSLLPRPVSDDRAALDFSRYLGMFA